MEDQLDLALKVPWSGRPYPIVEKKVAPSAVSSASSSRELVIHPGALYLLGRYADPVIRVSRKTDQESSDG